MIYQKNKYNIGSHLESSMLPVIRTFYQFNTKWCAQFAVAHALMIFLSKYTHTPVLISPWRVVINTWKWKYLTIFGSEDYQVSNKASSVEETFKALLKYGITTHTDSGRRLYFPVSLNYITKDKVKEIIEWDSCPVIAMIRNSHEICIVAESKKHYKVIDSLSREGYRLIPKKNISHYLVIK